MFIEKGKKWRRKHPFLPQKKEQWGGYGWGWKGDDFSIPIEEKNGGRVSQKYRKKKDYMIQWFRTG